MKKTTRHPIAEVPRRQSQGKLTIGIDLGDEPAGRQSRSGLPISTSSTSGQLQELGHEVIVANVRELWAISHGDRKSD
jgi:transposase